MKLVYKKLGLIWLNTEETLQAATTFIIYHKNTDIRLQITLCELEIFCFPFIKKMVWSTLYFYNNHIYSFMHALCDEWSLGERTGWEQREKPEDFSELTKYI